MSGRESRDLHHGGGEIGEDAGGVVDIEEHVQGPLHDDAEEFLGRGKLHLRPFLLADVAHDAEDHVPPAEREEPGIDLGVHRLPRAPQKLDRAVAGEGVPDPSKRGAVLLRHEGGMKAEHRLPRKLTARESRQSRRLGVDIDDSSVRGIDQDQCVRHPQAKRTVFLGRLPHERALLPPRQERPGLESELPQKPEIRPSGDRSGPRAEGENPPEPAPHAQRENNKVRQSERPHPARGLPPASGRNDAYFSRADPGQQEGFIGWESGACRRGDCRHRRGEGTSRRVRCPDEDESGSGPLSYCFGQLPEQAGKRDPVAPQPPYALEGPEPDFRGEEIVPGTGLFSGPGVS